MGSNWLREMDDWVVIFLCIALIGGAVEMARNWKDDEPPTGD